MKKVYLIISILVLSGCAPALQIGASLGGDIAASMLRSSNNSVKSDTAIGTQLGSYRVGEYEIRVSDGYFRNNPCINFVAYDNGRRVSGIYFDKQNPNDMKMLNDFNQMNEAEKKSFIRKEFLKIAKFDLDPVEKPEETASEMTETKPLKVAPAPFPTPSFAPRLP